MIIVKLRGGLGNQLFQYSLGRHLAYRNKSCLKLDVSELSSDPQRTYRLGFFNVVEDFVRTEDLRMFLAHNATNIGRFFERLKRRLLPQYFPKIINEHSFRFDPDILKVKGPSLLNGYWQSEKYFVEIAELLRQDLVLKPTIPEANRATLSAMMKVNSVSIHVRRGDYVTNAKTNSYHGVLPLDYFRRAIRTIEERVSDPFYFIFSDDIAWVRENIKIDNSIVVDSNSPDVEYEDLRLMASCKHNIIANSSFSWWGAWLNKNPEKIVVAPRNWFAVDVDSSDLVPPGWIRL